MQSLIHVLKVNDLRSGVKDGRNWQMQDCECILLTENGEADQVGVLMLPKDLQGTNAPKPGRYSGAFALRPNLTTRRIEAVLTKLLPVPTK